MPKAQRKKRPVPLSLRLTPEERAQLEKDATGMSLAAYIRARLFDGPSGKRRQIGVRTRGRNSIKDRQAIARALGTLGESEIARSLNELRNAAKSGSLILDTQTEKELREACAAVSAMRADFIKALGLSTGQKSK